MLIELKKGKERKANLRAIQRARTKEKENRSRSSSMTRDSNLARVTETNNSLPGIPRVLHGKIHPGVVEMTVQAKVESHRKVENRKMLDVAKMSPVIDVEATDILQETAECVLWDRRTTMVQRMQNQMERLVHRAMHRSIESVLHRNPLRPRATES